MLPYIKGFTFGWDAKKGDFLKRRAKESIRLMKERTGANTVIFALPALQDTPHTTEVDYWGEHMVSDDELFQMIAYAKSLDLAIILKPTVNCRNGTWRAHINFFDLDVPCEPTWDEWFKSYTNYQKHYAKIAEKVGAMMLIVGCEMVQTQRKREHWIRLIQEVRKDYSGLVSYNADKYQEGEVTFWDAVDVISSSGYYPEKDYKNQLERIKKNVALYNKPFFFAEAGCPSRTGSSMVPNDWGLEGDVNLNEQASYYKTMFEEVDKYEFVRGFGLWDWEANLYLAPEADKNDGYGVYNKKAEQVIKKFFDLKQKV